MTTRPTHHSEYGGGQGSNRIIPARANTPKAERPYTPSEQLRHDYRLAHDLPAPDEGDNADE